VPCPGCDRCNGGYIIRLSAGRPTSAHEHVFLLSKAARYFYDQEAVREEGAGRTDLGTMTRADVRLDSGGPWQNDGGDKGVSGRNLRNVWTIPTAPFADAHFATFPPALVERCIRAGTSERGCCAACGAPWVRVGDKELVDVWHRNKTPTKAAQDTAAQQQGDQASRRARDGHVSGHAVQFTTTGWRAGCQCEAEVQPCTVLDPFVGSGTAALVADRLQRHAIGIDLSIDYAAMAQRRLEADAPLFTSWAPAEHPVETEIADLFSAAAD